MRHLRSFLLLTAALACGGCFQLATLIHVRGDGSGTLEQRLLFTQAALEQLKQLAALGGHESFSPLSEEDARADAGRLGEGVTLVSTSPIADETGQGRVSTYAFTDINKLRVTPQPVLPQGAVKDVDPAAEAVTATLVRQPDGDALLTIATPQPSLPGARTSSRRSGGRGPSPEQIALAKQMFAGARVSIAVEPRGALVATSSAFTEGRRVTLMDVNVDQLLEDPTLPGRLQGAETVDELKAILKGAPGLKVNLDRAITIEFTPEN
jgi:hypothetical protein